MIFKPPAPTENYIRYPEEMITFPISDGAFVTYIQLATVKNLHEATKKELVEHTGITLVTLNKRLKELVDNGILIPQEGKGFKYNPKYAAEYFE